MLPKTQNSPQPPPKRPSLAVWLVSGAITLAIVALLAQALMRVFPDLKLDISQPLEQPSQPSAVNFAAGLQERDAVITDESDWLPESACPKSNRLSFEALKQEGMAARAAGQYGSAVKNLEDAFERCAAPEVLIGLNNARIGAGKAHTLVVAVPFSGNNPDNAVEMLRGAAQAQTQINQAGGIRGVPLKLLVVDDADSETVAANLATALCDDPAYQQVLGVIGHWTSDVSLKAAQIYRDRKALTFITPISTTKELTGYSDWVFRASQNTRSGAEALANHMLTRWDLQKAAIFYVKGVTNSEEIREEFTGVIEPAPGGEIVAEFDLSAPRFNAERSVESALEAGAEVIVLPVNNAHLEQAIAVIKANRNRLKVLGDVANLYTTRTLQEPGALGMVMALSWDIEGDANPAFVNASGALWKGPVNYVTAMSYSATMALATGLEKSPQPPTRASLQATLNGPNFTATGATESPLRFANGDRQGPVQLVEVVSLPKTPERPAQLDFVPVQPGAASN
jgi:branched-chain amino acid transport system substrate-binding protein